MYKIVVDDAGPLANHFLPKTDTPEERRINNVQGKVEAKTDNRAIFATPESSYLYFRVHREKKETYLRPTRSLVHLFLDCLGAQPQWSDGVGLPSQKGNIAIYHSGLDHEFIKEHNSPKSSPKCVS